MHHRTTKEEFVKTDRGYKRNAGNLRVALSVEYTAASLS